MNSPRRSATYTCRPARTTPPSGSSISAPPLMGETWGRRRGGLVPTSTLVGSWMVEGPGIESAACGLVPALWVSEPGGHGHPEDQACRADRHDGGALTRSPLARGFG